MDTRLHHLQGEADRVKAAELAAGLQDLYRDRFALRNRHVKGAEAVSDYEFNNAYQYIVARDETHLDWLRQALVELGASAPADIPVLAVPSDARAIYDDDVRASQRFVDKWQARLESFTNARHQGMLRVILGEIREQKRFFEQMLAGRHDLLGRRAEGASTGGGVLPTRWVE